MIAGAEKLKLVRELGVIRKNLPEVSGVNKLTLVKRVREIRQLLSVSGDDSAATLSIDPANTVESIKSLTDYLRSGISKIPEALIGAEADTALKIFNLLLAGVGDEEHRSIRDEFTSSFAKILRGSGKSNQEWLISAFEHFKSSGFAFDVDRDVVLETMKSIDELSSARPEDTPEISALKKEADQEYERLHLKLSELIAINTSNGYSADEMEKAAVEFEAVMTKKTEAWERIKELSGKKYEDQRKRIAELKDSIEPIGQRVIDALLNSSKVTQEQADSWANSQIIEKSALTKLKKMGYQESDIRRDMAEFYRITGGKLRQVRIETDGSRRANAAGIGHFEDNVIRPGSRFNKSVLWHELAHHLEADPAAKAASNGYLIKRRKSEKVYTLRSLTKNRGYSSNEVAYSDDFIDHYVGKVYRNQTTEVWSMGVQYLATPYDAAMMVAKDPEMAALMAGYLQADLSPAMKALQTVQNSAKDQAQEKREQARGEYDQALDRLAADVEIVDDGWFFSLDPVDQGNLLSRWGGIGDPEAKFIGSWGGYRVFTGKFRNISTKRKANGYAVVFADMTGTLLTSDNKRFIPNSAPVHGDERFLKAFMHMAKMNNNQVYTILYQVVGRESKIVQEANKLSSEQSS